MRTGIQSRWCPIRCEHVTLFSTASDPRSEPGLASNLGHFRTRCINCLSSESEDKMLIWHPGSGAGEEGRKGRFVSKEGSVMEMKGTLFLMGKDKLGQGNIFPKFCSLSMYPLSIPLSCQKGQSFCLSTLCWAYPSPVFGKGPLLAPGGYCELQGCSHPPHDPAVMCSEHTGSTGA